MKPLWISALCAILVGLHASPYKSATQDRSKDLVKPFDRVITIQSVAFSPDGRYLAAGSGAQDEKGEVAIWDANTHLLVSVFQVDKGVPSVAFSMDSKTLAAGSFTENCYLLDAATGKLQSKLTGHGEAARGLAFSPDGKSLAVGSYDNTIRIWDFVIGKVSKTLTGNTRGIYQLAYSPDGMTLAACLLPNDYTARLWDTASGKVLRTWEDYSNSGVRGIAYDPLGVWLATASPNGTVKLRDLKTDKVWGNFVGSGGAQWVAVAKNRKTLAVGHIGGKSAQVHSLQIGEGSSDELKRIEELIAKWDDDNIEERVTASSEIQKFGLMADPLLLNAMKGPSAETRMRARLAREAIHSPKPQAVLEGHWQPILGAAFSPDSQTLATGARDGQVILWDMATFKARVTLTWPSQRP